MSRACWVARARETLGCHAGNMESTALIRNPASSQQNFRLTYYPEIRGGL
jgi:hypothetical protein